MINIIDLSDENASFNRDTITADGLILKGSEGMTVRDKTFLPNLSWARANNKLVGEYLFWHPQDDPAAQVDNYLARGLDFNHPLTMSPVVDVENTNDDVWVERNQAEAQANLRSVISLLKQKTGRNSVWLYTYHGFWVPTFGNPDFSDCQLWVASYQDAEPGMFGNWQNYTLWQKYEHGSPASPTGDGDIDWSVSDLTVEEMAAL